MGQIDKRGSHFYLARYWAEALTAQSKDKKLQARFASVAKQLIENEATINEELLAAQEKPVDMGGYYQPDPVKTGNAMRPSRAAFLQRRRHYARGSTGSRNGNR